jgi:hypothetical protein
MKIFYSHNYYGYNALQNSSHFVLKTRGNDDTYCVLYIKTYCERYNKT